MFLSLKQKKLLYSWNKSKNIYALGTRVFLFCSLTIYGFNNQMHDNAVDRLDTFYNSLSNCIYVEILVYISDGYFKGLAIDVL